MALKTAKEYLDSMKKLSPRVYCGGKWVKNLLNNKITRSMVMANAAIYELAEDPKYKERATSTGAVAVFHKPIDHDDLLKVIRATLGSSDKPA